jgi:two-component system, sensor histidine kinase and response regulator
MLRRDGYDVRSFPRGRLALAAAEQEPPDLILLDINMPEMNGYEVCELLKSVPKVSEIPVVFLSALNETQAKVKAFQSGAVDYISKPFQIEEVHARVETHLKLHYLQRELKLQNERLETAVAARTCELAQANIGLRVLDRSKNEFLNLISHELRTPLNGILGAGDLILEGMTSTEENEELRKVFEHSRRRILSIVDDALLLTEIDVSGDQFRVAEVSLCKALRLAIARTVEFAASRGIELVHSASPVGLDLVLADEDLLVKALGALLETAVRFSEEGGAVRLGQEVARDSIGVTIETDHKTIPCDALPKFFNLFGIEEASTPGGDLGLGPAMASRILSLFGASVSVANRESSGIRLVLSLRRFVGC